MCIIISGIDHKILLKFHGVVSIKKWKDGLAFVYYEGGVNTYYQTDGQIRTQVNPDVRTGSQHQKDHY